MHPTFYATVLFVLLASPVSPTFGAEPISVSVCDIGADPGRFEGADVSVHGAIYVGEDATNMSDPTCAGIAIQLSVSDEAYRHKDIRAFEREVRKYGMRATATVDGQFHAKSPFHSFPVPTIDMHAIKGVVFEAK